VLRRIARAWPFLRVEVRASGVSLIDYRYYR
jgi:hypothetical protein